MAKASVNLCLLSGTVQTEVELSPDGIRFDLSSVTKRKEYEEKALVTIVAGGELARACAGLKIGDRIFVEGKINNKSKELDSGKKKYWTEVFAKDVQKI